MERPLDLIVEKVAEADFFLDSMGDAGTDVFAFRCYFSAFASAARSVTLTLQAVMRHVPGFDGWYEDARSALRYDPLAAFFVERRNWVTKTGESGIAGGSMRRAEGDIQIRHWFDEAVVSCLPLDYRGLDVETMACRYMASLVALLSEWEMCFTRTDLDNRLIRRTSGPRKLRMLSVSRLVGLLEPVSVTWNVSSCF